jgi:hypothetical protein
MLVTLSIDRPFGHIAVAAACRGRNGRGERHGSPDASGALDGLVTPATAHQKNSHLTETLPVIVPVAYRPAALRSAC